MNRVANVFVLVLALGLVATGVLLGYGNEAAGCGAPFNPAEANGEACDALLAELRTVPLALTGIGVTLGFAVLFANGVAPIVPRESTEN